MRAGAVCLYFLFRGVCFNLEVCIWGYRGVFDIFWILDMLAPGDAPPLSLACILQPSGVFFAIAAKMGLRQINLKSGKYVDLDTVINMHILLNFMRVKLYVWSISGFLYLVSHDVVFFSHPLPRLQSLIAIQLEMQLVLCDQL